MSLMMTSSQTVGPFVAIGFTKSTVDNLVRAGVTGERVTIRGRVLDGDGKAVNDAVVETWQANAHGRYAHPEDQQDKPLEPEFRGFSRLLPDDNGAFRLTTIKPGRLPGPGGVLQAPHLVAVVFMRGLLKHLVTRIYFPDEPGNADDPILKLVPTDRRATLIAKKVAAERGVFEWNVMLQGEDETVFFDY
jgi:protocatechuate 3,4-dioxygenase, alpha subunit